MKKVLIFYISRYSGHYQAAIAIEKGLIDVFGDVEVEKIDALSYTNPILEKIINKAYLEVIKKKPEFWGNIYDNPNVMKKTKKARDTLHRFNMSKVKKLIDKIDPDAVFCTQAFPCGMVADYKRSGGPDIPLIGVLTDYAPHSYWIYDEVSYYAVPSDETARVLEKKGVPSEKIKVLGLPVDPKFKNNLDAKKIKQKLGLEEGLPTILIMGGSQGLGSVEDVVASFDDEKHDYQLLVVAGSNKKLYSRLERLINKNKNKKIQVLPFIENIDELMEVSDAVVTKAGGMTIAESLVKGLPLLIVNPIPGHERMNADYLVNVGAAIEIKEDKIYEEINKLFDSKDILVRMREKIKEIARPESAIDIAKLGFKEQK